MSNLKRIIPPIAGGLKPFMAFFLAFITVIGIAPMNILAANAANELEIQGIVAEQAEQTPPEFMYLDGERVYLDDERIINVVNVADSPAVSFSAGIMAATSGNIPNVTNIFAISGAFARDPDVYMGATRLSAENIASPQQTLRLKQKAFTSCN